MWLSEEQRPNANKTGMIWVGPTTLSVNGGQPSWGPFTMVHKNGAANTRAGMSSFSTTVTTAPTVVVHGHAFYYLSAITIGDGKIFLKPNDRQMMHEHRLVLGAHMHVEHLGDHDLKARGRQRRPPCSGANVAHVNVLGLFDPPMTNTDRRGRADARADLWGVPIRVSSIAGGFASFLCS